MSDVEALLCLPCLLIKCLGDVGDISRCCTGCDCNCLSACSNCNFDCSCLECCLQCDCCKFGTGILDSVGGCLCEGVSCLKSANCCAFLPTENCDNLNPANCTYNVCFDCNWCSPDCLMDFEFRDPCNSCFSERCCAMCNVNSNGCCAHCQTCCFCDLTSLSLVDFKAPGNHGSFDARFDGVIHAYHMGPMGSQRECGGGCGGCVDSCNSCNFWPGCQTCCCDWCMGPDMTGMSNNDIVKYRYSMDNCTECYYDCCDYPCYNTCERDCLWSCRSNNRSREYVVWYRKEFYAHNAVYEYQIRRQQRQFERRDLDPRIVFLYRISPDRQSTETEESFAHRIREAENADFEEYKRKVESEAVAQSTEYDAQETCQYVCCTPCSACCCCCCYYGETKRQRVMYYQSYHVKPDYYALQEADRIRREQIAGFERAKRDLRRRQNATRYDQRYMSWQETRRLVTTAPNPSEIDYAAADRNFNIEVSSSIHDVSMAPPPTGYLNHQRMNDDDLANNRNASLSVMADVTSPTPYAKTLHRSRKKGRVGASSFNPSRHQVRVMGEDGELMTMMSSNYYSDGGDRPLTTEFSI